MRVLMLTHEYPPMIGGVSTYCQEIASAVADLGHEVHVVAPTGQGGQVPLLEADTPSPRMYRFHGSAYSWKTLPAFASEALHHMRTGQFDIVHALDWPSFMLCSAWFRIDKRKFVATVHGTEIGGMKKSKQVRLLCGKAWYRTPEFILTNSAFTRNLVLQQWSGASGQHVRITPLGVNDYWRQPADPQVVANVRSRMDLREDTLVLLTVARLDPRKGQDLVINALSTVASEFQRRLAYVVVGRGDESTYLSLLKDLASSTTVRVVLTGPLPQDEVKALYSIASCVVMPGRRYGDRVEGFGLAYLEAAAQGTPSIAASVGAVGEVVLNEETGLIVEENNIVELAAKIERLLADPALRTRLGSRARDWARSFTWQRCATETVAAYEDAVRA